MISSYVITSRKEETIIVFKQNTEKCLQTNSRMTSCSVFYQEVKVKIASA